MQYTMSILYTPLLILWKIGSKEIDFILNLIYYYNDYNNYHNKQILNNGGTQL